MAVSRNGNIVFADSTGTLPGKFVLIGLILSSTGANAQIVLKDSTDAKIDVRLAASGETRQIRLENTPIRFDTNIDVTTLTNAVATLIIKPLGG